MNKPLPNSGVVGYTTIIVLNQYVSAGDYELIVKILLHRSIIVVYTWAYPGFRNGQARAGFYLREDVTGIP